MPSKIAKTTLKNRWRAMIGRCHDPKVKCYGDYGGRGITVCDKWRQSFDAFVADMGFPGRDDEIDRIDNDKGYEPGNCRWVLRAVNATNRRNTRRITANGRTLHLAGWARKLGCSPSAILARIASGMSEEDAVTMPIPERPNAKLTIVQARRIRAAYPGKTMQAIADEFGVSKKTVLNIVHGRIFVE